MSSNLELIHLLTSFPSMANARIRTGPVPTSLGKRVKAVSWTYTWVPVRPEAGIEFCLSVWNQDTDWTDFGFRPFNVAYAIGIWDDKHRAASWLGQKILSSFEMHESQETMTSTNHPPHAPWRGRCLHPRLGRQNAALASTAGSWWP